MTKTCVAFRRTGARIAGGYRFSSDSSVYLAWAEHIQHCIPCSDSLLTKQIQEAGGTLRGFPCVHMAWHAQARCARHPNRWRCSDAKVIYSPRFNEYFLPDRSTRSVAGQTICFCPWCGVELPDSLRERWFAELAEMGLTDPWGDDRARVPVVYRTAKWWQSQRTLSSGTGRASARRRRTRK